MVMTKEEEIYKARLEEREKYDQLEIVRDATNFHSVTKLVRNYPNNQELGKFVRALVMKYTDSLLSKPNK